ncbi:hypothetical protein [Streptomyces sp. NPDC050704]
MTCVNTRLSPSVRVERPLPTMAVTPDAAAIAAAGAHTTGAGTGLGPES